MCSFYLESLLFRIVVIYVFFSFCASSSSNRLGWLMKENNSSSSPAGFQRPHCKPDEWVLVFWLSATGGKFNRIETGWRNSADSRRARFSCQDIFCGETLNMSVAKITLPLPTHTTDRRSDWIISHKPRLWAVTTFSILLCQEFSSLLSSIFLAHMQPNEGFLPSSVAPKWCSNY